MKKIFILLAFIAIAIGAYSQNVVRGEYCIDADPGFGKAIPFSISTPDSNITQAINIPYNAFTTPGYHTLFIRTRDANGSWSITARKIVEVTDNISTLKMVRGEYFVDADPGFGKATAFSISPQDSDITHAINITYSAFGSPGYHSVFIRTMDSIGDWSITARKIVEVADTTNPLTVVKVEYFFGTDKGFGNNSIVQLTPSADSTWVFNIPSNQLPAKRTNDTLFLRVKENSHNNWAITTLVDSLNLVAAKTITTGTITGSPFCGCVAVNIPFTTSGKFNAGNIYTAQLSDSTGDFTAAVSIGSLTSTDSIGTIAATIPCNTSTGGKYRIRVMASNFAVTGSDNGSNITINAPPVITVLPVSICFGASDTLTANGASTYTWAPATDLSATTGARIAANPTVNTTYTVTGKDANNCTAAIQSTVTVNALPATPVIAFSVIDSTLSDLSSAAGYQWYLNHQAISGATDQTYKAIADGDYTLVVTNVAGCESDTSNLFNVLLSGNGVKGLASDEAINIYPNPFAETITVSAATGKIFQLTIYNELGEVVITKTLNGTITVDLSSYPAGAYIARMSENGIDVYKKQLLKQ